MSATKLPESAGHLKPIVILFLLRFLPVFAEIIKEGKINVSKIFFVNVIFFHMGAFLPSFFLAIFKYGETYNKYLYLIDFSLFSLLYNKEHINVIIIMNLI